MRYNLQTRLLIVTLTPILLMSVLAAALYLHERFSDLATTADAQHELLIEHYRLRLLSDAWTDSELNRLSENALDHDDDLVDFSLLDAYGNMVTHSGHPTPAWPLKTPNLQGEPWHWIHRNNQAWAVPIEHLHSPAGQQQGLWLVMDFSSTSIRLQQYETAFSALILICLGLGLSAIFVLSQTRRLLVPLRRIQETATRLRGGHLDLRFPGSHAHEFSELGINLNRMLETLQAEVEDLKQTMTQTHEDLQSTLESMEVQNIELSLARKEAVEGNRIKSEFLANISHEIRTPLNGIMGFANLLSRSALSPRQLDHVQTIQKSANSLLAIINDVLDLSKIEAGKLVLDKAPLNIEDCIFDVITMLAPLGDLKQLTQIALIYDDVPRHYLGDPLRFKQVLTNLVSNAIKFTDKGDITIRVMLEDGDRQEKTLRISVSDTGIGMDNKSSRELFRAFTQADASTSRKYGGTGLGLVISKHLVEQMGGEISFESIAGEGSTFWFTVRLPEDSLQTPPTDHVIWGSAALLTPHDGLAQMLQHYLGRWCQSVARYTEPDQFLREGAHNTEILVLHAIYSDLYQTSWLPSLRRLNIPVIVLHTSTDQHLENLPEQLPQAHLLTLPVPPLKLSSLLQQLRQPDGRQLSLIPYLGYDLRILVVDDHPANLKLVATLLEDLGITVLTADRGRAALELVAREQLDLIFMDVQMPDMNGLEVTITIRNLYPERHLPIIALTAHAMAGEREKLLQAGMNDYMTKPLQEAQLVYILQKWTGQTFKSPDPIQQEPPETVSKNDTVDMQEGLRLAGGRKDLARDMLNLLIDGLPQEIEAIQNAFSQRQRSTLLDRVHYVHGASRYCGVPALRQAADMLETGIKQSDAESDAIWFEIEAAVQNMLAAMQALTHWRKTTKTN
ncbi:MAG: response regulator [Pseudomonadales bacterium]|nr:response regulator [Pseudomonadales bacterium]